MSNPHSRIVPELGRSKPTIILIVVVLPAPLGPRKANSSPRGISTVRPATATVEPYERVI